MEVWPRFYCFRILLHLYFHTGSHTCTTKPYIPDGFDEFILRNDRRKGPVQLQKDYLFEVSSKSFDYAKVVEEAKKVVDTERIKNKQRKNNKSSYPFGKGFEALGKYGYSISINQIYQDPRCLASVSHTKINHLSKNAWGSRGDAPCISHGKFRFFSLSL